MRREPGHQGIDLFPVPGGAEPGFADQEFARLAACEIEHLGGDETVNTITSAVCSARTARIVSKSGSAGASTMMTDPFSTPAPSF